MDKKRVKGKIKRKDGLTKLVQIHLPLHIVERLNDKYDYDSVSGLFTALALNDLGDIDLKKSKGINIEEVLAELGI